MLETRTSPKAEGEKWEHRQLSTVPSRQHGPIYSPVSLLGDHGGLEGEISGGLSTRLGRREGLLTEGCIWRMEDDKDGDHDWQDDMRDPGLSLRRANCGP
jgi:hypothetical protein